MPALNRIRMQKAPPVTAGLMQTRSMARVAGGADNVGHTHWSAMFVAAFHKAKAVFQIRKLFGVGAGLHQVCDRTQNLGINQTFHERHVFLRGDHVNTSLPNK